MKQGQEVKVLGQNPRLLNQLKIGTFRSVAEPKVEKGEGHSESSERKRPKKHKTKSSKV